MTKSTQQKLAEALCHYCNAPLLRGMAPGIVLEIVMLHEPDCIGPLGPPCRCSQMAHSVCQEGAQ